VDLWKTGYSAMDWSLKRHGQQSINAMLPTPFQQPVHSFMGAPVYHKSTAPATAGRSLINQLINVKVER